MTPVGRLSGGNQQKVVIGRWLKRMPRVLILDEPTRGVDIGARAEIHRMIRELAGKGMAVLVVSSEPDELPELCDRVLVMAEGRIVREFSGAERVAPRHRRGELRRAQETSFGGASMTDVAIGSRRLTPRTKAALGVFARYGTIIGLAGDDRRLLDPVAARLPDAEQLHQRAQPGLAGDDHRRRPDARRHRRRTRPVDRHGRQPARHPGHRPDRPQQAADPACHPHRAGARRRSSASSTASSSPRCGSIR